MASKYLNEKTVVDGITFASKKEARRYRHLKLLEKAGKVLDLRLQVPYEPLPKQKRADGKTEVCVRYVADFVYTEGGRQVVEDVKSEATRRLQLYVLKRKLMLWVHGIMLREV